MNCDIHKKDGVDKQECHQKAIYSVKLGVAGRLHLCLKHAQWFEKVYPKIKFDRGVK